MPIAPEGSYAPHEHDVAKQEQHYFGDGNGPEREKVWESHGEVEHRGDTGGDYECEDHTSQVGANRATYPVRTNQQSVPPIRFTIGIRINSRPPT